MKNKLFLICSKNNLEHFVRVKYGDKSYFLNVLGAVFNPRQSSSFNELISIITKEDIKELFIVNDISCTLIDNTFKHSIPTTYAEKVLLDLVIDNYTNFASLNSLKDKKMLLAELNVKRQMDELLSSDYLLQQVVLQKLRIKGLVTSKAEGKLMGVNMYKKETAI
jgi:carbonic anhydrase